MKIKRNARVAIMSASLLGLTVTSSAFAEGGASSQSLPQNSSISSPTTSLPTSTNGIFVDAPVSVKGGIVANTAVAAGYCQINLGNVHQSSSFLGYVAANGKIECAYGQSIRISSFVITLHKDGEIVHYFTGPTVNGVATYSQPLLYQDLKEVCFNSANSTYWSTAHAVGVYADGHSTYGDAISPTFSLPCGTLF